MKVEEIQIDQKVKDRWYPEKGTGVIVSVRRTILKVRFGDAVDTYDFTHAKQFLEVVE